MKRISFLILLLFSITTFAFHRGIYLTQATVQNTSKLQKFIQSAKKTGIDTFIMDIKRPSKCYAANVENVVRQGIHYVARVVVFPDGGTDAQVRNQKIWAKRLALMEYATRLGASAIQLDYIRYKARSHSSKLKAKRVGQVVQYFRDHLPARMPIQVDIFGVAAHEPSHTIGQDVRVLAKIVDAFCPMVYPSHYEPFRYHAKRPYETVYNSVSALKQQLKGARRVQVYAYIELYNYRYPLSRAQKIKYIRAQMNGAKDAGADGWYVWQPKNQYNILFGLLK